MGPNEGCTSSEGARSGRLPCCPATARLELQLPAFALCVHSLAQADGTAVAQLARPVPKLLGRGLSGMVSRGGKLMRRAELTGACQLGLTQPRLFLNAPLLSAPAAVHPIQKVAHPGQAAAAAHMHGRRLHAPGARRSTGCSCASAVAAHCLQGLRQAQQGAVAEQQATRPRPWDITALWSSPYQTGTTEPEGEGELPGLSMPAKPTQYAPQGCGNRPTLRQQGSARGRGPGPPRSLAPRTAEDEGKLGAARLLGVQAHQARHVSAGGQGGGLGARGRGRHPAVQRAADLRAAAERHSRPRLAGTAGLAHGHGTGVGNALCLVQPFPHAQVGGGEGGRVGC